MPRTSVRCFGLLLIVPLAGCFERPSPSVEATPRPVQVVQVALASERVVHAYDGVVRPRHEADIAFRTGGRIISREVDLGTQVTAGEVLARLDPVDLDLAVRSAAADLASAEAQARQAASDARRSRTLTAQGWNSVATDEVKQAATRAAAEKVTAAEAALNLARRRLDYAVLRAPTAGIVTSVIADPGTVVSEGQPVLRLAEQGAPEAEVALPEGALEIAAAPGAEVTFWAHPEIRLPVKLRELSPAADRGLRTYLAHYTIVGAPSWVVQGMTASIHLAEPGNQDPVASVPIAALADRGQGAMVWVAHGTEGRPEARPVQIRRMQDDRALVSGLRDGEMVVALGAQKLDPAARIRVADIRATVE